MDKNTYIFNYMDKTTHLELIKRVNLSFLPEEAQQLDTFLEKNCIKLRPWLKKLVLREIGIDQESINYINRSKNVQQKQK